MFLMQSIILYSEGDRVYKIKDVKKIVDERAVLSAVLFGFSVASGFVLSGTNIAGAASFADVSLAGGADIVYSAAVLTGGLVRSILDGAVGKNIVKIAAMVLILISKMFIERRNSPKVSGVTAFFSVFLSGAAVSAMLGEVMYKLVFYAFYSSLAGFSAYSVSLIIKGIRERRAIDLSSESGCAYAVTYTLFIASLCSVRFPLINAGIVIGTAVTLFGAYFYRHIGGVLCGALTTCGAFLSSQSCGMTVVLLPAAGLLTGYMYKQRINVASGFFTGLSFMLTVFTGVSHDSVDSMFNIICGTTLFRFAAPFYSDKWIIAGDGSSSELGGVISSRMGFLSESIGTVRAESEKIADILAEDAEERSSVPDSSNEVCSRCYKKLVCWKTDREATARGFRKLSRESEFSRETFPYELSDCLHRDELLDSFEKSLHERATAKLFEMRFNESRRLLSEQILIIEEIARAAGRHLDVRYSEPISKAIRDKLHKFGFDPNSVIAYYNSRNRLLAEIYFDCKRSPSSLERICDLISDELRISLEAADPVHSGRELRIRLFERPEYSLEVYGASICADGSKENGDTSTVFSDGTGISYVILSDGMGCGRDAAVESRMVVRMFRKLIGSGVDYNSAIRLINSIMVTKSPDETFATLDAVRIDLDCCGLTVIKSGATATLIRHRGSVMKISSPAFPIGIYERSETFSSNIEIEDGDVIIMFSDGISENAYSYIKELLLGGNDLKRTVEEICMKSEIFNPSARNDDVTVIGIKIYRTKQNNHVKLNNE